jgi:hypothetical protein
MAMDVEGMALDNSILAKIDDRGKVVLVDASPKGKGISRQSMALYGTNVPPF